MSKFCGNCGFEMDDAAVVCVNCGCQVVPPATAQPIQQPIQQPFQQQMPMNNQMPMGAPVQPAKKTQVSMILGIIGIITAWLFALIGHITSIIGIVLGIKEYKATGKMTGLVLSIIGEVCAILSSLIGMVMMGAMF